MSPSTFMHSTSQKSQVSPRHSAQLATPCQSTPREKSLHRLSSRPGGRNSADQRSTVFKSRIEKKRTMHNDKTTRSSAKATPSTGLIRLFINNRLGTKTEIPCSPSDTIGAVKKFAAIHLGTRPDAMILKRQSERPLKDALTLEDYDIHDGASLELEVDTCD